MLLTPPPPHARRPRPAARSDRECNLDGLSWAPAVASSNDAQAPCRALRESLQRVARDCANVAFLTLDGDAGAEARKLAVELGATSFPTVQYYKNGRLLFQSVGAGAASAGLGAGASLFLADSSTSEYVADVADEAALRAFIDTCASPQPGVRGMTLAAPCEKQIAVLDVSRADSPACMHVFPAVLALAKNTAGVIRWGRLLADGGGGAAQLAAKLKVTSTPTFVFFDSTGAEVGRYAGADRGALMVRGSNRSAPWRTAADARPPPPCRPRCWRRSPRLGTPCPTRRPASAPPPPRQRKSRPPRGSGRRLRGARAGGEAGQRWEGGGARSGR